MIEEAIALILSNFPLVCLLVGFLCAGISLARHRGTRTKALVFETLVAHYCLFTVGVYYLYNFIMHVFFGEMTAKFIGWADSPFQLEVGFASLGFAVVGLLAFRKDFGLRLAAIAGPACFLWGAAAGHAYQMIAHDNFAPGNAGSVFWTDIIIPIVGFAFLYGWRKANGCCATDQVGAMSRSGV